MGYWFATSCVLLLLLVAPGLAQQSAWDRIDAYLQTEMRRLQIPGLSLAVLREGEIAYLRSYGLSNLEHQVPVKPETIFQSGSMAKQFTAAAVMILVEDGKLSLDDRITRFFTDAPESWREITVRHLLTHTSGLGDYPPGFDMRRDYTEDEYLAIIKTVPLAFAPGEKWDYSNLGYVTLGILIRKVTGKFYGDFLAERVFQPLGMRTARVISEADIVPNRADGYRLVEGELKHHEWVSPSINSTADGSLYFSILDLARWDAALYTDQPLKQVSLTQMWTPVRLNDGTRKAYGFGWHTENNHNRRMVFHAGAWQGFKSLIVRMLDDRLTIVLLANSWETRELKLARGLISIFHPEFTLPAVEPIEDQEPKATASIRRVLLQLSQGKADPGAFTPEAQAKFFPERAREIGERLNSLSLPIAIIYTNQLLERREENGLRLHRYLLTDVGHSWFCTVALTRDEKIAGVQLDEAVR